MFSSPTFNNFVKRYTRSRAGMWCEPTHTIITGMAQIDRDAVQEFVLNLENRYSAATVRGILAHLHQLMRAGQKIGFISADPPANVQEARLTADARGRRK